jgi:DNA-binding NarL/FixJ family response regulator
MGAEYPRLGTRAIARRLRARSGTLPCACRMQGTLRSGTASGALAATRWPTMMSTTCPRSASTGAPSNASGEQTVDLLLASDVPLIAEAVATALTSRGLRTTVLDWPRGDRAALQQQLAPGAADLAVLLYDVDMSVRMAKATALLRMWSGPWLVLSGTAADPRWGGLKVAGVSAVRPSGVSLADVESLVRLLAAGGEDPAAAALSDQVDAWRTLQARHGQLQRRLDSLAPRQLQVLGLLRQGVQVDGIANRLGLSEATVRSQVQSVLRKLGVRSQLAAVAVLHAIEEHGVSWGAAPDQRIGDSHSTS